jgi:hypothetical protein
MKTFKNGPLAQWKKVKAGDVISFESTKARHVRFEVVANSPIEVWAGHKDDASDFVLVGATADKCRVEYTAVGTSYAMIKAEKNSSVYVNLPDVDQRVAPSEKDSHVSIEPRVRNNDEFAKMMHFVKLNERRRDEQLAEERAALAALRAELAAQATKEVVSDAKADTAAEPAAEAVQAPEAT